MPRTVRENLGKFHDLMRVILILNEFLFAVLDRKLDRLFA